ncbi:MAG: SDR family NAD(P)-dependent oxidoreductase [Hyphomonadaceae bacterium]
MTISFAGKTALITGVSSGLGEGAANVFAGYGARVIGVARRADRGEALARRIKDAGGDFTFVGGDLNDETTRQSILKACGGKLHILINNAGVGGDLAPIENYNVAEWDNTISTNLTAVFHLCRMAVPLMRAQRDGVILNIASINASIGVTKMAGYCAAKAGVVHLTKVIAAETVADGIRANAIILGGVASEMNRETSIRMAKSATGSATGPSDAKLEAYRAMMMQPEDVARSLAALCLPEAALITGSEIAIDRAITAGVAASAMIHGGAASLMS